MSKPKVQLRVNCGCGFKVESNGKLPEEALKEAAEHSEKTGHTQCILGEIRCQN